MPSFFPNNVAPLPQFGSLLVKGPYHPSAPIHLALSTLNNSTEETALFLSSSSIHLNLALRQHNDEWLATKSGQGSLASVSSRVQIFYPPTPAHLVFLLSTFHIVDSSANDSDIASSKSVLASCPSLIVLHELSSYFLRDVESDPTSHNWTISSYLSLVTHTASLISFLTSKPRPSINTTLILFDSRIDELKLPVVPNPSGNKDRVFGLPSQQPKLEEVVAVVQRYFQYAATFSEDSEVPEEGDVKGDRVGTRSLRFNIFAGGHGSTGDPVQTFKWSERRRVNEDGSLTEYVFR